MGDGPCVGLVGSPEGTSLPIPRASESVLHAQTRYTVYDRVQVPYFDRMQVSGLGLLARTVRICTHDVGR